MNERLRFAVSQTKQERKRVRGRRRYHGCHRQPRGKGQNRLFPAVHPGRPACNRILFSSPTQCLEFYSLKLSSPPHHRYTYMCISIEREKHTQTQTQIKERERDRDIYIYIYFFFFVHCLFGERKIIGSACDQGEAKQKRQPLLQKEQRPSPSLVGSP